jgi:hypothetical protein
MTSGRAMSEADAKFRGSAVGIPTLSPMPLGRAKLRITNDLIECTYPRGRHRIHTKAVGHAVSVTRYRLFPGRMWTTIWIDRASRLGFSPMWFKPVERALDAHGWHIELETIGRHEWREYIDGTWPEFSSAVRKMYGL